MSDLTKEQVEARRKEISDYYESLIPHLKIQAEYESLLASIEESRAKRVASQQFIAQSMSSEPEEDSKAKEEFLKAKKED